MYAHALRGHCGVTFLTWLFVHAHVLQAHRAPDFRARANAAVSQCSFVFRVRANAVSAQLLRFYVYTQVIRAHTLLLRFSCTRTGCRLTLLLSFFVYAQMLSPHCSFHVSCTRKCCRPACTSVGLPVRLPVTLFACLPASLSVSLSVYLPVFRLPVCLSALCLPAC